MKNIVSRPASFGLKLPELMNHPYFQSVQMVNDIDVGLAIQLAGMPIDEFQSLNPQMNRPVILAAGTPQLLLPYDNANRFVRDLPLHRGPAGDLDRLGRTEDDEVGRGGARGRHERRTVPRGQSHPGADADPIRLDLAGAARQCADRRRLELGRRQRDHDAHARRADAAQGVAARRQARQRRVGRAPLSRQRGAGGAVELGRRGGALHSGTVDRRLRRAEEQKGRGPIDADTSRQGAWRTQHEAGLGSGSTRPSRIGRAAPSAAGHDAHKHVRLAKN